MKVAFYEIEGWEKEIIKEKLKEHEVFFYEEKIDEINLPPKNDFEIISIFVDSRITEKVLNQLPSLKLVTTRSTGYDHLDLKILKQRNIKAAYVPGYGDNTVAEFTFGLILNLTRKIYQAIDLIKETGVFSTKEFRGIDLKNKTLGIIGTGRIGKEMIKIAKGFEMKVLAYDPYPDFKYAKKMDYLYTDLNELLEKSDIISLHCPYNKNTHHLINKNNINLIKKGAYLVNTARGGIVETEALVIALEKGILKGVALDVLEEEGEIKDELKFLSQNENIQNNILKTLIQNHILIKNPKVLITPHNAFNTQEALERILNTTLENIIGFINNQPQNLIED